MNRTEHILASIGEEAAEIGQAVGKGLRFGLTDVGPFNKESNGANLIQEINDLLALVEIAGENGVLDISLLNNEDIKLAKKDKYFKYLQYSMNLGNVQDEWYKH